MISISLIIHVGIFVFDCSALSPSVVNTRYPPIDTEPQHRSGITPHSLQGRKHRCTQLYACVIFRILWFNSFMTTSSNQSMLLIIVYSVLTSLVTALDARHGFSPADTDA